MRLDDATSRFELVDSEVQSDLIFIVDSITNRENHFLDLSNAFDDYQRNLLWISFTVSLILVFVTPYVFIFLLTGFQKQDSSLVERAWMMSWLAAGQFAYIFLFIWAGFFPHFSWSSFHEWDFYEIVTGLLLLSPVWLSFIPAIGGFVTVGKMFLNFSTCL